MRRLADEGLRRPRKRALGELQIPGELEECGGGRHPVALESEHGGYTGPPIQPDERPTRVFMNPVLNAVLQKRRDAVESLPGLDAG